MPSQFESSSGVMTGGNDAPNMSSPPRVSANPSGLPSLLLGKAGLGGGSSDMGGRLDTEMTGRTAPVVGSSSLGLAGPAYSN